MRSKILALALASLFVTMVLSHGCSATAPAAGPKKFEIDLDRAAPIALPAIEADLKPVSFKTPDGREGWAVRLPGNRPLATPAYADGKIYVGGGYGSHEFYAIDAKTGAIVWQIQTKDDGPTAAVVEDGVVAFNTESCTVIVADAITGRILWEEWLGDPLMSQPAIADGRLYMAYPDSKGGTGYHLLCAELKTGKHLWDRPITSDVVSAPIVDAGKLFFTCFDGTSFCLSAADGAQVWKRKNAGTSAPTLVNGELVVTEKRSGAGGAVEGIRRLAPQQGTAKDEQLLAAGGAAHLEPDKGGGVAIPEAQIKHLDASVGFATPPPAAQLHQANGNLGVNSVVGGWAFQGSKVAGNERYLMNAQGRGINNLTAGGAMNWSCRVRGAGIRDDAQVFSPPALGRENLYLCSGMGHLVSMRQDDGKVQFLYKIDDAIVFQPALAEGNLYAGTASGLVICLKTGSADADGWYAWGGNARHNKK
jgi:Ca-activated chloride channel family protein